MIWTYTLISVLAVSLISLIGIFTLSLHTNKLRKILFVLVAFAAGGLLGDVFFHLLPELVEEGAFTARTSVLILAGVLLFFTLEKFVHWHHCHNTHEKDHVHSFAIMNLVGDWVHNAIDGIIIAVSYLVSIPVGIATTIAVLFHEIPQEIGDFGVLVHGGFSKKKALFYNFLSGLGAVIGAVFALFLQSYSENVTEIFVPLTIGAFLYVAIADLIPELHKEKKVKRSVAQLVFLLLGLGAMAALLLFE